MRPGTISSPVVMSIFTGASILPHLTRRCARQFAHSSPSRMGSIRSKEYSMPSATSTAQMAATASLTVSSSISMPITVVSMSMVVLWATPVIEEMRRPPFRTNASA